MKKKIMVIAHFCDYGNEKTNNRFNYLADMLSRNGFDVELVTSSFSHKDKEQRPKNDSERKSYRTTLIYEPSYTKNISLKRLFISHHAMSKNLKAYLEKCQKPDLIYCAVPSINVSEVAAAYSEKTNIPFFIDVQDLWPEAYQLVLKNGCLYKLITAPMKKRVDAVYSAADHIVSVSDTYARRAKSVNSKCSVPTTAYLGTDAVTFDENANKNTPPYKKPDNEFWIGYCGTLGHSYDLTIVMLALKKLVDSGIDGIRLIVIGNGPLEEKFKAAANKLKIPCYFAGRLTYDLMCPQLCECDIAVNPIAKGAAQSIINKHADYAMAGLPVVNTQESREYRNLLDNYHCGINCDSDSCEEVAEAVKKLITDKDERLLMGKNSRRLAEERFDRQKSYLNIVRVIQEYV